MRPNMVAAQHVASDVPAASNQFKHIVWQQVKIKSQDCRRVFDVPETGFSGATLGREASALRHSNVMQVDSQGDQSSHIITAVYIQHVAGDVARHRRGEKESGINDLTHVAEAA